MQLEQWQRDHALKEALGQVDDLNRKILQQQKELRELRKLTSRHGVIKQAKKTEEHRVKCRFCEVDDIDAAIRAEIKEKDELIKYLTDRVDKAEAEVARINPKGGGSMAYKPYKTEMPIQPGRVVHDQIIPL